MRSSLYWYDWLVFICCWKCKNSWGDPSVLKKLFRIKTSGYDSPRTNLGFLEEDPTFVQQAARGSNNLFLKETYQRHKLGSPQDNIWSTSLRLVQSTVPKFNSKNLVGTALQRGLASPWKFRKWKLNLTYLKRSNLFGGILGTLVLVINGFHIYLLPFPYQNPNT